MLGIAVNAALHPSPVFCCFIKLYEADGRGGFITLLDAAMLNAILLTARRSSGMTIAFKLHPIPIPAAFFVKTKTICSACHSAHLNVYTASRTTVSNSNEVASVGVEIRFCDYILQHHEHRLTGEEIISLYYNRACILYFIDFYLAAATPWPSCPWYCVQSQIKIFVSGARSTICLFLCLFVRCVIHVYLIGPVYALMCHAYYTDYHPLLSSLILLLTLTS